MARLGRPRIHASPQRTSIVLDQTDLDTLDDLCRPIDCTRSEYMRSVLREHAAASKRAHYTLRRWDGGVLLSNDSGGSTYGPHSSRAELWNLIEQVAAGIVVVEVDQ